MKHAKVLKVSAIAVAGVLAAVGSAYAKALPARTITFADGDCRAKFVRSASGIVHETRRTCIGAQNPWVDADVVIHFRPLDGKPNPTCDADGLVTTFVFTNTDPALASVFPNGTQYNACVYLAEDTIADGTVDAAR
jgi:hypothetical protein